MAFSLETQNTSKLSNTGVNVDIVNAAGVQEYLPDGTKPYITVLGRNSDKVRAIQKKQQNRRLEAARRGKNKVSADEIEADNIEVLIAATVGWSLGKDVPFDEQTARDIYSNPGLRHIRDQVDAFIGDDSNFISA